MNYFDNDVFYKKTDSDRTPNFIDKEIDKFETIYTGSRIIRDKYETEKDLDRDWDIYYALPYHMKRVANNQSLLLYGKTNEDMYKIKKKEFLKNDIQNPKITMEYLPGKKISLEEGFDAIINNYNGDIISLLIMENEFSKLYQDDPIKQILIENFINFVNDELSNMNKIRIDYVDYFMPQEIIKLYENTNLFEDKRFIGYAGKYYGIAPYEDFNKDRNKLIQENSEESIIVGHNPSITDISLAQKRYNKLFEQSLPSYKFADLSKMDSDYPNIIPENGLSIITINEMEGKQNSLLSTVLVNFNPLKEGWIPLRYGMFNMSEDIKLILENYNNPLINLYYLELDESVLSARNKTVIFNEFFNSDSMFTKVLRFNSNSIPRISNPDLFTIRLLEEFYPTMEKYNIYKLYNNITKDYSLLENSYNRLQVINEYNKLVDRGNYLKDMLEIEKNTLA